MTSKQWTNAEVRAIRNDKHSHTLKQLEQKYFLSHSQLSYALYSYKFKDETSLVEDEPFEDESSKVDPIFTTLKPEHDLSKVLFVDFVKKVLMDQATYLNEQFRKIFKKIK